MRRTTLFLVVFALAGSLWAADPIAGTWKENVAKSQTVDPNKSQVAVFTDEENGLKLAADGVSADGKSFHAGWAAKFDGKDYPLTGFTNADTIAIKKIGSHAFSELFKKAGKEVMSARLVFSKDGRTMTRTTKERNTEGKEITNTYIFERQ